MLPDDPGSDDGDARIARREAEVAEFAGRVGCLYTKKGLSPPFFLRDAAREWLGLSQDEIVAVIEKHFDACRRFYISGSGDAHFGMVRSAISKPSRRSTRSAFEPTMNPHSRGGS